MSCPATGLRHLLGIHLEIKYHPIFYKERSTFAPFCDNLGNAAARQGMNQASDDRQGITHFFYHLFQESSHTKLSQKPQHLSSGQIPKHNPTNGTQTTFRNSGPGKKSRLLLWPKIVHPWPVGVLYVDRNLLPNDAQFHVHPRVDCRTCTRYQREWY